MVVRGPLSWLLRGWSLEAKSLTLIGGTLLISLFVASFFIQFLARRLVMETTRQAARDFATSVVAWEHLGNVGMERRTERAEVPPVDQERREILIQLRNDLLSTSFSFDLLRLDTDREYEDLGGKPPSTPGERDLLEKLEVKYQQWLERTKTERSNDAFADELATKNDKGNRDKLAYEIPSPNREDVVFREVGPVDGYYYYYHPVRFRDRCITCHGRKYPAAADAESNAISDLAEDASPFRVIRVKMPYENTRVWTIWSLSILITVGLIVLAVTSFIVHRILKRLVIKPLSHLREVSDAISAGNWERRAAINTEDEFHALSQAYNGMLRRIIESQSQLQGLNRQLDDRIDQLAQANLQLFEANKLKSDFLANITHELRTPLNSILGFSDMLLASGQLSDKLRRYAENIQTSGRHLLALITDVLDLAKMEAGKMEVHPTHFELRPIVHSQCEMIRKQADDKNIEIQIEDAGESTFVYQDQTKLQQILTNLLSNAIKFTPEGGLVTVRLEVTENRLFLSVADTGVGIPEDDFEIIFQKFRQSSTTSSSDAMTREYSGTGLGLSIVRELCKLLGGDIQLCSELGKGSTFRVIVPSHFGEQLSAAPNRPVNFEPTESD